MSELDALLLPKHKDDAGFGWQENRSSSNRKSVVGVLGQYGTNEDGNGLANANGTNSIRSTKDEGEDDDDDGNAFNLNLDEVEYDTLKLCAFYLATYLAIAIIAFSYVFEKWTIIDSIYFAVSTFTTCGYGDQEPTTQAGQLFTIPFAIYGVMILGVFIGVFGHALAQAQNKAVENLRRTKEEEVLEILFDTTADNETEETDPEDGDATARDLDIGVHSNNTTNDDAQAVGETETKSKSDSSMEHNTIDEDCDDSSSFSFVHDHMALLGDIFQVLRSEMPAILVVTLLSLILGYREGWSLPSSLYFCLMSATTTGYGDYSPTTQLNKLYCVMLYPISVAVFGEVLGRIANAYIRRKQRRAELKILRRTAKACDLRRMDANGDGCVDREEFICFMLVALQKVPKEDIDELKAIFDSLDTSGDGTVKKEEIVELVDNNRADLLSLVEEENHDDAETASVAAAAPTIVDAAPSRHRRYHSTFY